MLSSSNIQKNKIKLSIVIPVYNEEKRLETAFREVDDFMIRESANYDLEIIFVNDGSKDSTKTIIEKYAAGKGGLVKLISYDINMGKGYAVRKGILASQGEYSLMLDADMSTPLTELGKFRSFMEEKIPVIIGTRKEHGAVLIKKQPWYRQKMGEIYALFAMAVTGLKIKDFGCGFKLFSRDAGRKIFIKAFIDRWIWDTEALYLAKKYGYEIREAGVNWKNDEDTRLNALKETFRSVIDLVRIVFGHWGK